MSDDFAKLISPPESGDPFCGRQQPMDSRLRGNDDLKNPSVTHFVKLNRIETGSCRVSIRDCLKHAKVLGNQRLIVAHFVDASGEHDASGVQHDHLVGESERQAYVLLD